MVRGEGTAMLVRSAPSAELTWSPDLARRSPLFWPLDEASTALERQRDARRGPDEERLPAPETIDAALQESAGMRFERQTPVPRRRKSSRDPNQMYNTRISRDGVVPTRAGSLHDLMNALVWATFPKAKRALHERQETLVVPASPGESARRSRELDALALFDEGGVVVVAPHSIEDEPTLADALARHDAAGFVFGHAIYEGLVLGRPAPLASVVVLMGTLPGAPRPFLEAADRALAETLRDRARLTQPREMLRVRASSEVLRCPWRGSDRTPS